MIQRAICISHEVTSSHQTVIDWRISRVSAQLRSSLTNWSGTILIVCFPDSLEYITIIFCLFVCFPSRYFSRVLLCWCSQFSQYIQLYCMCSLHVTWDTGGGTIICRSLMTRLGNHCWIRVWGTMREREIERGRERERKGVTEVHAMISDHSWGGGRRVSEEALAGWRF